MGWDHGRVIVAEINLPGDIDPTTIAVYVLIGVVVMAAALIMSWALVAAARRPPPAALITALSMLTLFSIAGGIATSNDEAWTIAAAGMGALAGSVTSMFQEGRHKVLEQVIAEKTIAEVEAAAVAEAELQASEVKENSDAESPVESSSDPGGGDRADADHPRD